MKGGTPNAKRSVTEHETGLWQHAGLLTTATEDDGQKKST